MDTLPKEIKQLREMLAAELGKLQTFKADEDGEGTEKFVCYEDACCMINDLARAFSSSLDYIHQRINRMEDSFYNYTYEHSKGHPMALKTASNVEKYLKACGMDNDYNVQKPVVWVASSNRGDEIVANFVKPKVN